MDNQAAPAAKQTKGIKKLWLKFKASMKTDQPNSSKNSTSIKSSTPAPSKPAAPVAAQSVTESTPPQIPDQSNTTVQSSAQPESKKVMDDTKPASPPAMASELIQVDDEDEGTDEKIQLPHMGTMSTDKEATALRYQRAQDVFRKYNMEIEPADWQQVDNSSVPRVEKKTRMRVRYNCHECKQTFGREKTCSGCGHTRCTSCVRYPAKRTGDKAKQKKQVNAVPTTSAAPTTGSCHECKTTFDLGATECENCNHEICSRCLKDTVLSSPATAPPPAQPVAVAAAS